MSQNPYVVARQSALRLVGLQVILVVVFAVILALFGHLQASYSILFGGLVSVLPSFYFARKFFACMSAREVKKIMKNFYLGEVVKLVLTAALFVIIVKLMPLNLLWFILGYVVAQLAFCLAPLLMTGS